MPSEKKSNEPLKVTDKRIFTAEGDLKDEYRSELTPRDPSLAPEQKSEEPKAAEQTPPAANKKEPRERGANPGTPFTLFVESLIVNAYMSLGLIRNPYQAEQPPVDLKSARQLIDILTMLEEKTKGNLTEDEFDFLDEHLSELKLAYVQRSKTI